MTVTWLISKQGIWRQISWRSEPQSSSATSTGAPLHAAAHRRANNFVPGFILYAMEMFSVLMLFISLFIIVDPLQRLRAPAIAGR